MKRFLSFGALLLTMAGLLVSCHENVIDDTLDQFIIVRGEINVATSANDLYDGCDVVTSADELELLGSNFEIKLPNNDKIQTVMVLDKDDNPYLMARLAPQKGKTIEIDEYSTTLALVTMHPLLAPIEGSDYYKVVEMITSSDKFD